MSNLSKRALSWTPRILSILFITFVSLFAIDVFDEHLRFWQAVQALALHLTPSFVLIAALILAWRWEWIGAVVYALAGSLYVSWVVSMSRPVAPSMRLVWGLTMAGPAFLIAGLFMASWLKHSELHPHQG